MFALTLQLLYAVLQPGTKQLGILTIQCSVKPQTLELSGHLKCNTHSGFHLQVFI